MKIVLVASRLHTGGGRVVGQKIIESVCQLCPNNEILAVFPADAQYSVVENDKIKTLVCPRQSWFKQIGWNRTVLNRELNRFRPDWVWALGNYPIAGDWRQSVLIHDPHLMFESSWFRNETVTNKAKKWATRSYRIQTSYERQN